MYEAPCRAEGNADDVGTDGDPAVESVALRERRSLHKANSVAISRRAMLCARRAKLGHPQPEFRAGMCVLVASIGLSMLT